MNTTLATWHTDHANFARLLDLLEAQLDLFHRGETPHYELMLDIMFYMTHYPDVLHHPKEDMAFTRIRERETGDGGGRRRARSPARRAPPPRRAAGREPGQTS